MRRKIETSLIRWITNWWWELDKTWFYFFISAGKKQLLGSERLERGRIQKRFHRTKCLTLSIIYVACGKSRSEYTLHGEHEFELFITLCSGFIAELKQLMYCTEYRWVLILNCIDDLSSAKLHIRINYRAKVQCKFSPFIQNQSNPGTNRCFALWEFKKHVIFAGKLHFSSRTKHSSGLFKSIRKSVTCFYTIYWLLSEHFQLI